MLTVSMMSDNGSFGMMNSSEVNNSLTRNQGYYDPNKDECTLLARLVINTVIAGGVCFLGLAGNALSFSVLRRDKQTPVASFLLQTLAFMDSFFLGLWFLLVSVSDIFEYARVDQHSYRYWMYTRLYSYPFLFIFQTATIWVTVLIALTRFIAICIPYRAAQLCNLLMVQKSVAIVTVCSFVYNLPRFFDTKIVPVLRNDTNKYYFSLAPLGESKLYRLIYLDIAYYIFSFVLPLLILAVLNSKLTLAYRKVQQRRRNLRGRGESEGGRGQGHHSDPNITLVMIIVVLVFMLCNLPARVVQIVWKYRDQTCMSAEFFIKEISNVLEVLNSSTNFIIYCVFRKQFRDILRNQLCCIGRSAGQENGETTMHTMVNGYTKVNKEPEPEQKDDNVQDAPVSNGHNNGNGNDHAKN